MDSLTPYEQQIFKNVDERVKLKQLYNITKDRPDLEQFLAALEKYSENYGKCLVIDRNNMKFKRIPAEHTPDWCKERGYKHWIETIELFYK